MLVVDHHYLCPRVCPRSAVLVLGCRLACFVAQVTRYGTVMAQLDSELVSAQQAEGTLDADVSHSFLRCRCSGVFLALRACVCVVSVFLSVTRAQFSPEEVKRKWDRRSPSR